ncbi:hypothetical protein KM043_015020 [Ampulex compressa]|nr:hypothetical protein KM043_015020 [Ampulex compressa]
MAVAPLTHFPDLFGAQPTSTCSIRCIPPPSLPHGGPLSLSSAARSEQPGPPRNYKRSQLKRMSLNGLGTTFGRAGKGCWRHNGIDENRLALRSSARFFRRNPIRDIFCVEDEAK